MSSFGVVAGALYIADRALSRMPGACRVFFYDFMVQPVGQLPPPDGKSTLELREVRPDDAAVGAMPARADVKAARFAQRATCLGAFRGNSLVGHIWIGFGRWAEDEVLCRYVLSPPGESVFDFDVYVHPSHRMGRTFARLWACAGAYLRSRGIRYSYSRISRFNPGSRTAHQRLGAMRIGSAVFLRMGRMQAMLSTLRPYFHLTACESRRVDLLLSERPGGL